MEKDRIVFSRSLMRPFRLTRINPRTGLLNTLVDQWGDPGTFDFNLFWGC